MKPENQRMMAGLIFERRQSIDIHDAMRQVTGALETCRVAITGTTIASDVQGLVQSDDRLIHLAISPNVTPPSDSLRAGYILRVCVENRSSDMHRPASAVLMAEMIMRLHATLDPSHVMWLDEAGILTSAAFLEIIHQECAPNPVRPAVTRAKAHSLPPIDDTHDPLQARCEIEAEAADAAWRDAVPWQDKEPMPGVIVETPENLGPSIEDISDTDDSYRVSAWLLSIAVAIIALPLGAALIVINLVKGENLRLVSQCAALLGLFSALSASGASAETLELVGRLLT